MLSTLNQLFKFMRVYRKFWMAPLILGLIAMAVVAFTFLGVIEINFGGLIAMIDYGFFRGLDGFLLGVVVFPELSQYLDSPWMVAVFFTEILLTLVVSWFTYRYVERPARYYLRRRLLAA